MTDIRTAPTAPTGIVHLGLGAFARAFACVYVQEAMEASGGDWGITGVSLRSADIRDRLAGQDWAYHAVTLEPDGKTPLAVNAINEVFVAPEDPARVLDAMDRCRIVTITVTEKGYCHIPATGRLDLAHPDIRSDLDHPDRPVSMVGFLVRGLARRRANGRRPFTVLSCDNLPENGKLVRDLVRELAAEIDPALRDWIETEGRFPCSMVDRITPATTEEDMIEVQRLTGTRDTAPVMCEPFRQFVVEDAFVDGARPDFEAAGVQMVSDVLPYEHMKLRMLNGTHSSLAYLGYLAGCETIADTVGQPVFETYARHLWHQEIIPVLAPPPGVDLAAYAAALLQRYANPGIRHRTWQICMDGSQKLPQRILGTVQENRCRAPAQGPVSRNCCLDTLHLGPRPPGRIHRRARPAGRAARRPLAVR